MPPCCTTCMPAALIGLFADVCAQDSRGWTALHWAAHNGALSCALALIENSASQPDVDAADLMNQSPLHMACLQGHTAVAQLLLEAGAEVNAASAEMGTRPIHRASMGGNLEITQMLIRAGAEINCTDEAGFSPIHWAANGGHTIVVTALIEAGADLFGKCLSSEPHNAALTMQPSSPMQCTYL